MAKDPNARAQAKRWRRAAARGQLSPDDAEHLRAYEHEVEKTRTSGLLRGRATADAPAPPSSAASPEPPSTDYRGPTVEQSEPAADASASSSTPPAPSQPAAADLGADEDDDADDEPAPLEPTSAPGTQLATAPASGGRCTCDGRSAGCRKKRVRVRCPASGDVIPVELTAEQCSDVAGFFFGLAAGVASVLLGSGDEPTPKELRATERGLKGVSKQHDMQWAADLSPYIALLQGVGSYSERQWKTRRTRPRLGASASTTGPVK